RLRLARLRLSRPSRRRGWWLDGRAHGRLEPLDPPAQLGAQARDLLLDGAAAMVRLLDLAGQGTQLRFDRIDARRKVRQGVARETAAGAGARLGADLGLDELGVAIGEDPPLDRAQLLLD